MAGRIPQQFIDELVNRIDIVEVIDARVPLKKAGREYTACCPFHAEKTPSFTVSPGKQFYHCFGCGAHGTALGFLMDYEHLSFVEAVEELARQAGLEVPREGADAPAASRDRGAPDLYGWLEQAAGYYRRQLRQHPQASRAVAYLKGRGLTGEIAAEFGIGFAPPGWDNLVSALSGAGARREQLIEAGLAVARDTGGLYDRFRDRIMFPIRDRRGRVIAFGGRMLGDGTPKYLNSSESPIFHKGRELYGLYEARRSNRKLERLLVVEGYMDVVALAQFGVRYAVATLGTATTREHLEQVFRAVPEVVFCFDGDRAGRAAAWRAVENTLASLRGTRQARFMFLPEGEDPDSLVRREGAEGFEARIADAVPFSEFFFEELSRNADTRYMDGRARLVELARPLLGKLPAGAYQDLMVQRLAELSRMDRERLDALLADGEPPAPARPAPAPRGTVTPVRLALALVLQTPPLAGAAGDLAPLRELERPGVRLLVELVEFLGQNPHLNTAAVLEHWRDTQDGSTLAKLAQWDPGVPSQGREAEFLGALDRLRQERIERRTEQLLDKSNRESLSPAEKQELKELLRARQGQVSAAGEGATAGSESGNRLY